MKIGLITAFPPERDGVGDYSFHLVNSISEVSADCIFHVIAPMINDERTSRRLTERITLYRTWQMKSIRDVLKGLINIIRILLMAKVDVLHIQYRFTRDQGGSAGEPFLILMIAVRKLLRKPKIVISLHDFWLSIEAQQRALELTRSRLAARFYRLYYAAYIRAVLNTPDLIVSLVNSSKSRVTESIRAFTKREVVEILHGLPSVSARARGNTKDFGEESDTRDSAHACSEIGLKWFLFPFWYSCLFLISIWNPNFYK